MSLIFLLPVFSPSTPALIPHQTNPRPRRFEKRTDVGHLGHLGDVRVLGEARLIVVDVVDLDDELGLALQRLVGQPVDGLGVQDVVGLLLAVQPLGGVDVAGLLVDLEQRPGALAGEDVTHAAVSSVAVRVELQNKAKAFQIGNNTLQIH